MGGNLTIALQGTAPRFDGVATLGYSAIQTVLPRPDGQGVTFTAAPGDNLENTGRQRSDTRSARAMYPTRS